VSPTVHMVVPEGVDDRRRPSGGNTYDRRLGETLDAAGWSVQWRPVGGAWPAAGEEGGRALHEALHAVPGDSVALVDGLVATDTPDVLVPASQRLRLVVLLHMPAGLRDGSAEVAERERAVLAAATSVITTSRWSRRWVLAAYGLDPGTVHVVPPGVDPAEPAVPNEAGRNLLCVGAVSYAKGHDVLLGALERLGALSWRCVCAGDLTRAPSDVALLRRRADRLAGRVDVVGPLAPPELDAAYAGSDLVLLPSRVETYGMVVTEALARGLPVVAAEVGGVPEALGVLPDGRRPGLLVPVDEVDALAAALRRWLTDRTWREGLRRSALEARAWRPGWPATAAQVAVVLAEAAR
jgi:glycosyltransferase involved in cell wall biosynthesis